MEGRADTWELDPGSCHRTLQSGGGMDSGVESGYSPPLVLQIFINNSNGQTYQRVQEKFGNLVCGNGAKKDSMENNLRASKRWTNITGKKQRLQKSRGVWKMPINTVYL